MSNHKRLLSGKKLREFAQRQQEKQQQQEKNSPSNAEAEVQIESSSSSSLSAFLDRQKTGFDPLRYAQEDQVFEDWSGELDPNKVLLIVPVEDPEEGTELSRLCLTLGFQVGDSYRLKQPSRIHPGTYFGQGTLDKILQKARAFGCGVVVFDIELSPSQVRNVERHLKIPVLDREAVILSIFKRNAQTKLAKLQVELAELKYYSSRLSGLWMGLSRQRGARGGLKGRGVGETQLELDRRTTRQRIQAIQDKLKAEEKTFETQSKNRRLLPRVALVGYTNAGKSTLMNRLTGAKVLEEDKLFSTLDTTVRALRPPTEPQILLSDTVGFIKNLPHDLVASFKSTLREAVESSLVLVVVDLSHSEWENHIDVSTQVLDEIEAAALPKYLVLNKTDRVAPPGSLKRKQLELRLKRFECFEMMVWISALEEQGLDELKLELMRRLSVKPAHWLRDDYSVDQEITQELTDESH